MMRDTPRTFVGSVIFSLNGPVCTHIADAVHTEIRRLAGVSRCILDAEAGTLLVTADDPVDRTDVVALLDKIGCPVHA